MTTLTTDHGPTDEELAARAARRDPDGRAPRSAQDAFARLYERHGMPLVAFLAARTPRDDLDDLRQEVWTRVWAHLPGGFRGGNFRAWLFEIARNAAIDHGRKRRPNRSGAPGDGQPQADPRASSPDAALLEGERAEALRRCLERLPRDAAQLVQARLGGAAYSEICGPLGLTPNQAYKVFHAAKAQLQACLERALE